MRQPLPPEATTEAVAPSNGHPPEAVPIHDRLLWDLADISALTGLSRRLLERQRAAGKLPPPDMKAGRRVLWRPATIESWISRQGGGA